MDLQKSIETCIKKKYATFDGRASKGEYWWFVLFGLMVGFGTAVADIMFFDASGNFSPLNSIASLALFIPNIAVGCRRLHDVGKSGWWQLISFTIIGLIPLIIWLASDTHKKKNQFGPVPKN